jgi:hypothetical protein
VRECFREKTYQVRCIKKGRAPSIEHAINLKQARRTKKDWDGGECKGEHKIFKVETETTETEVI